MLNRGVLIVCHARPFLEWAAGLDDSGVRPLVEGEQTVYLIPEFEDDGGQVRAHTHFFGIAVRVADWFFKGRARRSIPSGFGDGADCGGCQRRLPR